MALTVLHVTQPTEGGVARCVDDLVHDQLARGFRVGLAAPEWGSLAGDVRAAGAEVHRWEAARAPGPATVPETLSLARILRRVQPDLLHLHSSKAGLAGRLAVRGGAATVFQPHGWSFEAVDGVMRRAAERWERAAARWAHALVCVSDGERRRGEEVGIRARFRVIPNGVDLEAFAEAKPEDRARARERLARGAGEPLAVCVGRLSRAKGQDILLRAWPAVRERVPDASLVLVGAGPDEQELRRLAGPGVELVGERDDVADWLAAADVAVLPSRWEAMSLVLLEAMARGRSVVVTDVPGARDVLEDGDAVVAVNSPAPLAAAIADRLLDPDLAAREGARNRKRVEQFDVRRMTEGFAAVYHELFASRRPR